MTLEDLIQRIDYVWNQIEQYPDSPRGYNELYPLIINSLEYLSNKKTRGVLFKRITGDLGDRYHILFNDGFFYTRLVVAKKTPNTGYVEGIIIDFGKLLLKGPDCAQRYKKNLSTGAVQLGRRIKLF